MKAADILMTNNRLTNDVTAACLAALKAGMSREEVTAVLSRIVELIESADDAE
jgi:hypothetical protein